jgi:hypothetical protein
MKKSTKRKPRRPKSGAGMPMMVRMHKPQVAALDRWIDNSDISRPEAIRQLVSWALEQTRKDPIVPPGTVVIPRDITQ